MKEIELIQGQIHIPPEFELSKNKRRLTIRTPWMSRVDRLCKDDFQVSSQQWFRCKTELPFIPKGFVEIDGIKFKVITQQDKIQRKLTEVTNDGLPPTDKSVGIRPTIL